MKNCKRKLLITLEDGSIWVVPVEVIIQHHAKYHAHMYDGDIEKTIVEHTKVVLKSPFEVEDWIESSMEWTDIEEHVDIYKGDKKKKKKKKKKKMPSINDFEEAMMMDENKEVIGKVKK